MTRALGLGGTGYLLTVLLVALGKTVGFDQITADVPLVLALHLGLARRADRRVLAGSGSRARGALLDGADVAMVLVVGYLADVLGAEIKGVHGLVLGVVYLLGRMVARRVYLSGIWSQAAVVMLASLVASVITLGVHWIGGYAPAGGLMLLVLGQALLTAAMAPALLGLFAFLDAALSRERSGRTLPC